MHVRTMVGVLAAAMIALGCSAGSSGPNCNARCSNNADCTGGLVCRDRSGSFDNVCMPASCDSCASADRCVYDPMCTGTTACGSTLTTGDAGH